MAKSKTGRKSNNPNGNAKFAVGYGTNASLKNVPGDAIAEAVSNAFYWFNQEKVKSDEEVAERLNDFFAHCSKTGELPTVEKLALCLGTYRDQLWEWEHGRGLDATPERALMIKKAKGIIAALDAELAAKQKISPVVYIFRAKNFYGMRDQVDNYIVTNNNQEVSAETLAEKYGDIIDVDIVESETNEYGLLAGRI